MQVKHVIGIGVLASLLMLGGCKIITADGDCIGPSCIFDCSLGGICFP